MLSNSPQTSAATPRTDEAPRTEPLIADPRVIIEVASTGTGPTQHTSAPCTPAGAPEGGGTREAGRRVDVVAAGKRTRAVLPGGAVPANRAGQEAPPAGIANGKRIVSGEVEEAVVAQAAAQDCVAARLPAEDR